MRITFRTKWHRRFALSVLLGVVFLSGLTIGNKSAHKEMCDSVSYSQGDYQLDVRQYGQKVADFNDGFATAARERCGR